MPPEFMVLKYLLIEAEGPLLVLLPKLSVKLTINCDKALKGLSMEAAIRSIDKFFYLIYIMYAGLFKCFKIYLFKVIQLYQCH